MEEKRLALLPSQERKLQGRPKSSPVTHGTSSKVLIMKRPGTADLVSSKRHKSQDNSTQPQQTNNEGDEALTGVRDSKVGEGWTEENVAEDVYGGNNDGTENTGKSNTFTCMDVQSPGDERPAKHCERCYCVLLILRRHTAKILVQ